MVLKSCLAALGGEPISFCRSWLAPPRRIPPLAEAMVDTCPPAPTPPPPPRPGAPHPKIGIKWG
jgi:hypothetical protein